MAFISANLVTGSVALLLFPLHLAVAGPASLPLTLILGWALAQWPLALFLSRTGNLTVAQAASAAIFALFIGGIAAVTGGIASFALLWLILAPVEAALTSDRRAILSVTALCVAEVALLALLGAVTPVYALGGTPEAALAISSGGALAYAMMMGIKIAREQQRGEGLFRHLESRLKMVNDEASDMIALLGEGGDVITTGGSCEALLGTGARQVQREGLFQRLHVADRPAFLKMVSDVERDRCSMSLEVRLRHGRNRPGEAGLADYRSILMECRPASRVDARDRGARVLAVLRAPDRASGQVAGDRAEPTLAAAGHELRGPLNAIAGFSDVLRERPDSMSDAARRRDYAELIHASSTHLLDVVDGMLGARGQDGLAGGTDLVACLQDCVRSATEEARMRNAAMVSDIDPALASFPMDEKTCRQIVINLLSNALKASQPGGRVELMARHLGNSAEFRVTGTGTLTSLNNTVRPGPSEALPGAEIGLALVKGLAELHGGSCRVETTRGNGTSISVILPLETGGAKTNVSRSAARLPVRTVA
jgi:cell cycle sensor histidine kinase DivJ